MAKRPLKLNKDGSLKLIEADVSETILDFLRAHRFEVVRTPATRVRYPSGQWGWIHEAGHPDYICLRPDGVGTGKGDIFYMELKAPQAKTNKQRKAAQAEFARVKREQGFLCYLPPDSEADQYVRFVRWFNEHFWR